MRWSRIIFLSSAAVLVLALPACGKEPQGKGGGAGGGEASPFPVLKNERAATAADAPGPPRRGAEESGPLFVYGDQIYLGRPLSPLKLSHGDDRFFGPLLSPDGKYAAFTGLATGVRVVRVVDGGEVFRSEGTYPSWGPGSDLVLFEKTADDGHVITASDLYLASLKDGRSWNLTRTPGRIERRPVFSPGGGSVSFEVPGAVLAADIVWEGR